jgi:hypothetical protein
MTQEATASCTSAYRLANDNGIPVLAADPEALQPALQQSFGTSISGVLSGLGLGSMAFPYMTCQDYVCSSGPYRLSAMPVVKQADGTSTICFALEDVGCDPDDPCCAAVRSKLHKLQLGTGRCLMAILQQLQALAPPTEHAQRGFEPCTNCPGRSIPC